MLLPLRGMSALKLDASITVVRTRVFPFPATSRLERACPPSLCRTVCRPAQARPMPASTTAIDWRGDWRGLEAFEPPLPLSALRTARSAGAPSSRA